MAQKLTDKQQKFIDEYLKCFNATEACRRAGYKGNGLTLAQMGCENLSKPYIKEKVAAHFMASAMSREEAIERLATIARATVEDFADVHSLADLKGHPYAYAVKKATPKVYKDDDGNIVQTLTIELEDKQAALDKINRVFGSYQDKVEISGNKDQPLVLSIVNGIDLDDI